MRDENPRFLVLSYPEVEAQSAGHTTRLLNEKPSQHRHMTGKGGVPDNYNVIAIYRRQDGNSSRGTLEVVCERKPGVKIVMGSGPWWSNALLIAWVLFMMIAIAKDWL